MEQLDLLNSHLLESQFAPYTSTKNVFEKFDKSINTVSTGFTYSNGLTEILSKVQKKLNP